MRRPITILTINSSNPVSLPVVVLLGLLPAWRLSWPPRVVEALVAVLVALRALA